MNLLKNLGKKRESTGALSGKVVRVGPYQLKVESLIGEGGFATIYRVVDVSTRVTFALKHFMLSGDPEAERDVQTEIAVMKSLASCPYTLALHAYSQGAGEAMAVVDYCVGNLASQLHNRGGKLSNSEVANIFVPVCKAVYAMHAGNPPLAHRDVKAENVLLHPEGRWVLCDFGSASKHHGVLETTLEISREEERVRKQTTPAYRAPELWDLYARQPLGLAVDIWALGCLLYLLCYDLLPFDNDAKLQVLNGSYTLPPGRPPVLEDLIRDMLVVDPLERISAEEILTRLSEAMQGRRESSEPHRGESKPMEANQQQQEQQGPMGAGVVSLGGSVASTQYQQQPQQQQQVEVDEGWATFGTASPPQPSSPVGGPAPMAPVPAPVVALAPASRPSSVASSVSQTGSSSRPNSQQEAPAAPTGATRLTRTNSEASAGLATMIQKLQVRETELEQHCKALEQLLEDKKYEADALRNRIQEQELELRRLRVKALDTDELKEEVRTLKAELERLRKQQQQPSQQAPSFTRVGSGSGNLTSFPIGNGEVMSTPGQPMRPSSRSSEGRTAVPSVSKATRAAGGGNKMMAFDDLNPLM